MMVEKEVEGSEGKQKREKRSKVGGSSRNVP